MSVIRTYMPGNAEKVIMRSTYSWKNGSEA
ncbi:hypothetical protein PAESOLCIP111_01864 [Paenibacillus solanacearum]|uniref:Uncharacterized protein n=1 Tax=Paenibacillus solanacearum TaxID=2048548 RepID=A0A916NWD5_9BACL|nr:hypothetical protein PAESOLCIP111_01864 [Paenibacillus solanacearum]